MSKTNGSTKNGTRQDLESWKGAVVIPIDQLVPCSWKTCSKCKLNKKTTEFSHSNRSKDGLRWTCKGCNSVDWSLRRKNGPTSGFVTVTEKLCNLCRSIKSATEFSPDNRNRTRLQALCKSCFSSRQKLTRQTNPEKTILSQAESRSRRFGLPFNLTLSDIVIPKICPVLGIPIQLSACRLAANSPTLDRIIPSKGYVKGNVVVMSWRANRLKGDGTPQEIELLNSWIQAQTRSRNGIRSDG